MKEKLNAEGLKVIVKSIILEQMSLHEQEIGNPSRLNYVKLADALVNSGVVKDEFTDLSGVKSSTHLVHIIKKAVEESME